MGDHPRAQPSVHVQVWLEEHEAAVEVLRGAVLDHGYVTMGHLYLLQDLSERVVPDVHVGVHPQQLWHLDPKDVNFVVDHPPVVVGKMVLRRMPLVDVYECPPRCCEEVLLFLCHCLDHKTQARKLGHVPLQGEAKHHRTIYVRHFVLASIGGYDRPIPVDALLRGHYPVGAISVRRTLELRELGLHAGDDDGPVDILAVLVQQVDVVDEESRPLPLLGGSKHEVDALAAVQREAAADALGEAGSTEGLCVYLCEANLVPVGSHVQGQAGVRRGLAPDLRRQAVRSVGQHEDGGHDRAGLVGVAAEAEVLQALGAAWPAAPAALGGGAVGAAGRSWSCARPAVGAGALVVALKVQGESKLRGVAGELLAS
mmetsp:Transcript_54907/g.160230  ORF Transcript_54907/g.160230 Transcript_54907/m.160230 type:complete len:370 (+) Transcript_54907:352-1461(+)